MVSRFNSCLAAHYTGIAQRSGQAPYKGEIVVRVHIPVPCIGKQEAKASELQPHSERFVSSILTLCSNEDVKGAAVQFGESCRDLDITTTLSVGYIGLNLTRGRMLAC